MKVKVKILKPLPGVFAEYQPEVGSVYDASYQPPKQRGDNRIKPPVCIIEVQDKKICLRTGEYELCGGTDG
jgi:hypothetical protein